MVVPVEEIQRECSQEVLSSNPIFNILSGFALMVGCPVQTLYLSDKELVIGEK